MKKHELLFYEAYEEFYAMAAESKAFAAFCRDAFGEDFSQDGFSDIHQINKILPHIPEKEEVHILDIGCGNGKMLGYLQKNRPVFIHGFDYSEQAIKKAKELFPVNSEFKEGVIGETEYPEEMFDLIVSMDTMYFAKDMTSFVGQVKRWLKHEGVFFVGYQEGDVVPKTENADRSELAKALMANGMEFHVLDITRETYDLLRKKREAALAHQKEFEAEGNKGWFDMLMFQTEYAMVEYEEFQQKMARYLYVAKAKPPFCDIPGFDSWESIKQINKGWSSDKKYKIITKTGEELLLRIANADVYEDKKKEYDIICKYAKLGFEMSKPVSFGICNQGESVYMLLSWVKGEDLETAMETLTKQEQYELGRCAGKILKQIHSIPIETEDMPKQTKREKKLYQLGRYEESGVRIADDETALQYVKNNIGKIWREKPVYQHGDFHPGNLILTPEKTVGVIDFNRWEVGDPYEEFYKLESFGVEVSVPYCIGQIDAYFDDTVPKEFWETLAVYVAHASLYSIKWAEKFGQEDMDGMIRRCEAAMEHYEGFTKVVPSWYDGEKRNFHVY